MSEIFIVAPGKVSRELASMIQAGTEGKTTSLIDGPADIPDLRNKKILFAAELNAAGANIPLLEIFSKLYERGTDSLSGSTGVVMVRSCNELNTKSAAQNIVFLANSLGCSFLGHPLVEAISDFQNFHTWQKQMNMSLQDICMEHSRKLCERLIEHNPVVVKNPNILVLHASFRKTSNTLELWHMVSKDLKGCSITELHVENGEVLDCKGCSFKTCIHYSLQNSCFYGGVMVKDILPSIEKADAVIWVCPNYNDAISANLTAVINRLTALYRKISFCNKSLFSVIVSGNSGSDSVAKQLIGSLVINKGFRLPPYFSIMAIANDTGQIKKAPHIKEHAKTFAQNIIYETKA